MRRTAAANTPGQFRGGIVWPDEASASPALGVLLLLPADGVLPATPRA
jgi:hypothetical protein